MTGTNIIQDGGTRVLLTGVTGFIGGRVAACLLDRGWSVHALVRQERSDGILDGCAGLHVYDGTGASVTAAVARALPDVVIHLATAFSVGTGVGNAERLVAANLLLPMQLVEAMLDAGCTKLINTGSFWQHAGSDHNRPFDLYAATKTALEAPLSFYHHVKGLTCVTLKLFDSYGPGDPRRKIATLLIDAVRTGQVLDLSPGDQILDLLHVDDVASAFAIVAEAVLAFDRPYYDEIFVSGERLTLKALVEEVGRIAGRPVPVRLGARPYRLGEIMEPIGAPTAAILRNWYPSYSLDSGMRQLIAASAG